MGTERTDIGHLFDIAHHTADTVPQLSAHYMSVLQRRMNDQGNELSSTFVASHCRYCNVVFLPGSNCTVRVNTLRQSRNGMKTKDEAEGTKKGGDNGEKPVKDSKTNRIRVISAKDILLDPEKRRRGCRRNVMVYLCHVCLKETEFYGTKKGHMKRVRGLSHAQKKKLNAKNKILDDDAKAERKRLLEKRKKIRRAERKWKKEVKAALAAGLPPPEKKGKLAAAAAKKKFSFSSFLGTQPSEANRDNKDSPGTSQRASPALKSLQKEKSPGMTRPLISKPSPNASPKPGPGLPSIPAKAAQQTKPEVKKAAAPTPPRKDTPPPSGEGVSKSKKKHNKASLIKKLLHAEESSKKKAPSSLSLADFLKTV